MTTLTAKFLQGLMIAKYLTMSTSHPILINTTLSLHSVYNCITVQLWLFLLWNGLLYTNDYKKSKGNNNN